MSARPIPPHPTTAKRNLLLAAVEAGEAPSRIRGRPRAPAPKAAAEGTLNLSIASGNITDQYGYRGTAFSGSYQVDIGERDSLDQCPPG